MKTKKKPKEDKIEFKIITIGDSNVGKTSIIRRYIDNKFDEQIIQTIGINNSKKKLILKNGIEVYLNICDTMGQERFQSMNKSYVRNADVVLLVFDLSNKNTFINNKKWMDFLNDSSTGKTNALKYLIGNKKDLEKDVDDESIKSFLEDNKDFTYKATSAKDEDDQINTLFQEMGEILYQSYKKTEKIKLKTIKLRSGENSCCS